MALRAALFLTCVVTATADAAAASSGAAASTSGAAQTHETKAEMKAERRQHELDARQDQIQAGRKDVHKALASMSDRATHLAALAKDGNQINLLADKIEHRIEPTLSQQQRKATEEHYQKQLDNIRDQDMSAAGAEQAVAGFEASAKKDLNTLNDADRQDARSLDREFSKARRDAHLEVREAAKSSRQALRSMGSATGLEMLMERAGKGERDYDRAEDDLGHEKDTYEDQIDNLQDRMDDTVEDIYSHVHEMVQDKAHSMHEARHARTDQHNKVMVAAADGLKMSGSLARVEDKLTKVEAAQKSAAAKAASSDLFAVSSSTNTVCMALLAVGLAVSLVMHAQQRRSMSRIINQPELLA